MKDKDMNGKELAAKIKQELKEKISEFTNNTGIIPKLAIIAVGDDPSAGAYIKSKQKTCKNLGVDSELIKLPETASLDTLKKNIDKLNCDTAVHGIIIEAPLPQHIPFTEAALCIAPVKDIDGLNPLNLGLLYSGKASFIPNTPMAVMRLIEEYKINLTGSEVTLIGRSISVGKPLFALLQAANATVTACHTKTKNLLKHTKNADILIVAAGKAKLITAGMVKKGACVIDVGINVIEDGSIVGDVDYEAVYPDVSLITPVPGGVGPLTVAMIIDNTLKAAKMNTCCRKSQQRDEMINMNVK